jgi:hypothetical protein
VHDDAAGGDVDGVEPGLDEGNQGRFDFFGAFDSGGKGGVVGGFVFAVVGGGELDAEEGSGVFEAGAAVGSGGELDVDDSAEADVAVEEVAAEEVADEEGAFFEGGQRFGGEEEVVAGEALGVVDAVAALELEDDATSVLAGGEPVVFDVKRGRTGGWSGEARFGDGDGGAGGEDLGEVAEGFGEEFAFATLGPKEASDGDPA